MGSLSLWLQELGLEQYAAVFARHDVDLEALRLLTEPDLEKLGVSLGHRRKLLKAIAALTSSKPGEFAAPSHDAERRQLSVLVCDLVGSTSLSEQLDPEPLRDLMQAYQRACREVVARYDGHVAQYRGDGVMVYFGWPRAHEDDATRAIRAALETTEAVSKLVAPVPIRARVGVHTGLVVVGETGHGDASVPKEAVGETPNIAARLEGLAEPGGVVVSDRTRALAEGLFDYADLGLQALKGLSRPVRAYRVLGTRQVDSRFEASHSGVSLTPLIGRQDELVLLLRRFAQAKDGEGQLVLLCGEPGIGKSRLVQALREQIAGQPHALLRFQCSSYHVSSALYPVIEHIERAAGFTREDSVAQKLDKLQALLEKSGQHIAEAAPIYAALLSLPTDRYPHVPLSAQRRKERTLELLVRHVEALAAQRPVLMVFEDAHWIDPSSQELLHHIVSRLRSHAILLVVTHRPEYVPVWADRPSVTRVTLDRLNRQQSAELVGWVAGGKTLPQELLDQILARTDGVPLFTEELTKSVLESHLVTDAGDHYTLQAPQPALAIPPTLRDSLIARLDRLAPIREVAQIGACIGREFSYELLAALSPLKGTWLEKALEQLTETGLVSQQGKPPNAVYAFKHALVQDAAYDSLLKSIRRQVHSRIARILEQQFPAIRDAQPEILAHHYTAAGLVQEAIGDWLKAGELALQHVALKEAIAHLNRGLELVGTLPASRERDAQELALRTPLGAAWVGLRGWVAPEVEATFTAVLGLAKVLDHRSSYLPALHGLYSYHMNQGRVADSLKWVREVEEAAEALDDADLRITGHRLAQNSYFYLGRLQEAQRHGDRIAALYNPEQGRRIETLTNIDPMTARGVWDAVCLWLLGYPDQALHLREVTEAHARARGRPFGLCWVLTIGSGVFDMCGDPDLAIRYSEEAQSLARTHGIPLFSEVFAPLFRAVFCMHAGRTSEAIPVLRDLVAKWNAMGAHVATPYWRAVLGEGLACAGDTEQGLALIAESLAQIERPGWEERWALAEVLRLKGWMLAQQDRLDEADRILRAAIEVAREQHARSWELRASTTLAHLLAGRGDRDAARVLLAGIYDKFTEGFGTRDLKEARALLDNWGEEGRGKGEG